MAEPDEPARRVRSALVATIGLVLGIVVVVHLPGDAPRQQPAVHHNLAAARP